MQCNKINLENKLYLNNESLPIQNYCKSLGVTIDKHVSFTLHIDNLIKTAYARLRSLYKFKYILSTSVKLKITESLILSLFDYCDTLYGPCLSVHDAHRIQVVQNACMRFSANLKKRDHVTPSYIEYGWVKMNIRREIHFACLIQKILVTSTPAYLREKLIFAEEVQNRSRRNPFLLQIPRHSTSAFESSFTYYASTLYNGLPQTLKIINNLNTFKTKIKAYFSNIT